MNESEWLESCKSNRSSILSCIGQYHPASHRFQPASVDTATAELAQKACNHISEEIRSEAGVEPPSVAFAAALESGDIGTLSQLMNQTWFGVPENTNCWSIPGFSEMVELIEDLPEEE